MDPDHKQPALVCKGDSESKNESNTTNNTLTDYSEGSAYLPEAGQGVVGRVSNLVDSQLHVEIQQSGLSGNELSELLAPAGDALESISRDYSASKSANAAISTSVTGTIDALKDVAGKTVEAAKDAAIPITIGVVGYYLLRKKKS